MVINLSKEHSLVSNWVAELRDVTIQNDRMRFRRNLERIGEVAAFEISRRLPYIEKEIQTPLALPFAKCWKNNRCWQLSSVPAWHSTMAC
jgi:uracil phosphoribosyltransferase